MDVEACANLSFLLHARDGGERVFRRLQRIVGTRLVRGTPPQRSEQSLLILLVTLLTKQHGSKDAASCYEGMLRLLRGITLRTLTSWGDCMENGFVGALFLELVKFEESNGVPVADGAANCLIDLLGQLVAELDSFGSSHHQKDMEIILAVRIIFNVISKIDCRLWLEQEAAFADRILVAATVAFRHSSADSEVITDGLPALADVSLLACARVLEQLSASKVMPQSIHGIAEMSSRFLAEACDASRFQVRGIALIVLAKCAILIPEKLVGESVHAGIKFLAHHLMTLETLGSSSPTPKLPINDSKLEMKVAANVIQALLACSEKTPAERKKILQSITSHFSRACLIAHLHGQFHFTPVGSGDRGEQPCSELEEFTDATYLLLLTELKFLCGGEVGKSQSKWFIVTGLEYCNELLNEHALVLQSPRFTEDASAASRGCLSRLLPLICRAAKALHVTELTTTLFYSLIELMSHTSSADFVAEIVQHIVLVITSASTTEEKHVELAVGVLGSVFARTLGVSTIESSNDALWLSDSTLSMLSGVSLGLDSLATHFVREGSVGGPQLLRLRTRLIQLFENVATDIYGATQTPGFQRKEEEEKKNNLGLGLGFLLKPISTTFLNPSSMGYIAASNASLQSQRSLWYALVVFRLIEREYWNDNPDWLDAYQIIAANSPALALGPDEASVGVLEKELASSPIIQEVAASSGQSLVPILSKVAQFPISKLDFSQVVYGVTFQFLESLRVGGTLDIRPMFTYLSAEETTDTGPSGWLHTTIDALSHHVFSVWLESASEQLRGTVDSSAPSWKIRSAVGQVFEFLVGRCAHHNGIVRTTALSFAKRSFERIPWLMWTPTAVFTLLDTIQSLSARSHELNAQDSTFDQPGFSTTPTATTKDKSAVKIIDPEESDASRIVNAMLSPEELPQDSVALSDTTRDLYRLAHEWFSTAAMHMASELDTVVQEYLLLDRVQGISAHAGVALATALTSMRSHQLSGEYAAARPFVPCGGGVGVTGGAGGAGGGGNIGPWEDPTGLAVFSASNLTDSFSAELKLKSTYMGEVLGMLTTGDFSLQSVVALAESLYSSLSSLLLRPPLPQNCGLSDEIIPAIWRCFALIHYICSLLLESGAAVSSSEVFYLTLSEWTHRLLRLVSSCAVHRFTRSVIEGLVLGWRWLFLTFPRLRNRVLFESLFALQWTCKLRIGMFAEASEQCDCLPNDLWIAFIDKSVQFFGDHDGVVFSSLENVLFSSEFIDPKNPLASTARFQILRLGLKVLASAHNVTTGPCINRRRALRERIHQCVFDWFNDAASSPPINPSTVRDSHAVLSAFLADLLEDAQHWTEDYYSTTEESRAAGRSAAVSFLDRLAGGGASQQGHENEEKEEENEQDQDEEATAHLLISQRDLGISLEIRKTTHALRSGTLCLLRMLLLEEIDRLAAWQGGAVGTSVVVRKAQKDLISVASISNYKIAVKAAWCISPSLASALAAKFPKLEARDGRLKGFSHITLFLMASVQCYAFPKLALQCAAQLMVYPLAPAIISAGHDAAALKKLCMRRLVYCAEGRLHVCLDLLSRLHDDGGAGGNREGFSANQHLCSEVVRFASRCLETAAQEELLQWIPQSIQLLRRDDFSIVQDVLLGACLQSAAVCHVTMWHLLVEASSSDASDSRGGRAKKHGFCNELPGVDPLSIRAAALIQRIRSSLDSQSLRFLDEEVSFFSNVTQISALLKLEPDRSKHKALIAELLSAHVVPPRSGESRLYLPVSPSSKVLGIVPDSGTPMRSAAKCPFLLSFLCEQLAGGPDELFATGIAPPAQPLPSRRVLVTKIASPTAPRSNPRRLSLAWPPLNPSPNKELRSLAVPASPAAGTNNDVQKQNKSSVIFKVHDDCRQDILTLQVICILRDEFERIGLPLVLVPYTIIPTRTGPDLAIGGMIEVINNVKSRDQIGKMGGGQTLLEYFIGEFGQPGSATFKHAQLAFISSLAAYAVACHLLAIKVSRG